MKVRITDKSSFEALRPLDVAAYVRSTGWRLTGFWGTDASVWSSAEREIVLPEHTQFADFALRMAEVVAALAEVEKRSQLELFRDLTMAAADVVRVRVASPLAADGSVGLDEGVMLFNSAREMILSAARATVSPRPYFRSRLPGEAEEYLRKVRLGQTERGSYVATIVCPVSPELQTNLPGPDRRTLRPPRNGNPLERSPSSSAG